MSRKALLLAIAFFAFLPTLGNGFVNYDDNRCLTQNPRILHPSPENFLKLLIEPQEGLNNPMVYVTYAVEYAFFGLNPLAYHTTHLILHLLNILLVFGILTKLRLRPTVVFIAALLFAVHPIQVETVAWISNRKDLLYSVFYLASLRFYLNSLDQPNSRVYLASLGLFQLSILSKAMAVSLPVVLWLIHRSFYPRRPVPWARLVPFILISGLSCVLTLAKHPAASAPAVAFVPLLKFIDVCYAPLFYLSKLFWPTGLCVLYPLPKSLGILPPLYLYAPFIIAAGGYALFHFRKTPLLLFGAAFYLVSLLPVLPFFNFNSIIVADRYAYLPSIGIFMLVGQGLDRPAFKSLLKTFGCVLIAVLCVITFRVSGSWFNSQTLFDRVLTFYPYTALAYLKRGDFFFEQGQYDRAGADYDQAIALSPFGMPMAYHNRAVVLFYKEEYLKALAYFERAILFDEARETSSVQDKAELMRVMRAKGMKLA